MFEAVAEAEDLDSIMAMVKESMESSSFSSVPKVSWSCTISSIFSVLSLAWAEHNVNEAVEVEGPEKNKGQFLLEHNSWADLRLIIYSEFQIN